MSARTPVASFAVPQDFTDRAPDQRHFKLIATAVNVINTAVAHDLRSAKSAAGFGPTIDTLRACLKKVTLVQSN